MADDMGSTVKGRSTGSSGNGSQGGYGRSRGDDSSRFKARLKEEGKYNAESLAMEQHYLEARKAANEKFDIEELQYKLSITKKGTDDRKRAEKELNDAIAKADKVAFDATMKYQQRLREQGTAEERKEHNKRAQEALEAKKKESQLAFEVEFAAETDSRKRWEIRQKRAEEMREEEEESRKLQEEARKLDETESMKSLSRVQEGIQQVVNHDFKGGLGTILENAKDIDLSELAENFGKNADSLQKELQKKRETLEKLNVTEDFENGQEVRKTRLELENEIAELEKEHTLALAEEWAAKTADAIVKRVNEDYNAAYKEAQNLMTDFGAHFNARMQGTWDSFQLMRDLVTSNLSLSPFVKTQDVLNAIKTASDEGIAYNLEQRAFLSTIADKVANTFDAFDSNLTRLIRLQQADSTAARLGMEALLTRFLNGMYEDTSYLNRGGLADAVAAALIDAESQLGRNAAAEFEFAVQKWLGSLSSLGMSDTAITNIAQGINYLATGNVTSLASNNSLQTLFAMSANRAGLSYADLLTKGLNASNVNSLLKSMVEYLKEIAENSDNQVVKGAYGNIFNMSLSDLKAVSNLMEDEISYISDKSVSYTGLNQELVSQFAQIPLRMSLPEMLSNIYNNAIYGVASDMASNPVIWTISKMLDLASGLKTDIAIPYVSVGGFGIDLNTSVFGILRMANTISTVMGLVGTVLNGLAGIASMGGLNLSMWGGTETTTRAGIGNLLSTIVGGVSGSQTTYRTNFNKTDTTDQSLAEATADSKKTEKITNAGFEQDEDEAKAANKATVAASSASGSRDNWFWVRDTLFELVYSDPSKSLRVIDEPFLNYMEHVFGDQSLTKSGVVQVSLSGSNYVNVLVNNSDREPVPVKVVNSYDMIPKQQAVSITGGKVEINQETLVRAIQYALGFVDENNRLSENTLSAFIDAAVGQEGIIVKGKDAQAINVNIKGADPGVTIRTRSV